MKRFLSPETLDTLRAFDSPTISNAIEAFNVRDRTTGYASMELRCQFPDLKPMVGYAVTCTADSTSPGPRKPNKLHDLFDAIVAAPKPAVVVIQNSGPDRLRSCFGGDMVSAAYQRLGAVGVVTDGGFRDLNGIRRRAPGFHIFAPGVVVSHGNAVTLEVGVPVSICGLDIQPGDLLHGDNNGLLKVPIDIVEPVLEQARLVWNLEAEVFDFLQSRSFSLDELKCRFTL